MPEMDLSAIQLVVFDMAGTTVRDNDEVLSCFSEACVREGIMADKPRLNALMGVSKLEVFQMLWREQLGDEVPQEEVESQSQHTFHTFRMILEGYYRTHPVEPTEGALEVFSWLRSKGIKFALNTGFYREVTDIILEKLGWLEGLDEHYVGGPGSVIDFSISSDQVPRGRPEPHMIQKAMEVFGVPDPRRVVKVGDTPVDLEEGRRAGCLLSLAVVNGTHRREELEKLDNDGLLTSLKSLPAFLEQTILGKQ